MSVRQLLDLLLLAALWGGSFLFMRVAVPEFGVIPLVEIRVAIGALVLIPFMLHQHSWQAVKGRWWDMAFVGFFNSALPFSLLAYALITMSSGMGAIFNSTVPMFTALIAYLWLKEHITPSRLLGIMLGALGVVVLVWGKVSFHGDAMLSAVIAALLATLSYGVAALYTRLNLVGVPSVVTASVSLLLASLMLLPLALMFLPQHNPSLQAWIAAIILGVLCTGSAYILFYRLINQIGATKAVTVTFVIPLFATLWGALWLHEVPSVQMVLGGLVIIAGMTLSTGLLKIATLEPAQ